MSPPAAVMAAGKTNTVSARTNRFAFRLANTTKTIGQLASDRHAILLENALIETDTPGGLKIPAHLRAGGEPGAFIVQARGGLDAAFRAALTAAGGQIVSYIPNNAYLVRLSAAGAGALAGNPLVQAVLPYDPYFKVQSSLLGAAVNPQPLPDNTYLTLGLFSDTAAATITNIENMGGIIVGPPDRSPFGPVLHVQPPANWIALAQLPGVQIVEPARRRVPANDLSRQTLGVASTSVSPTNYLNLTGANVLVEVNDTGVDVNHPDLAGRVLLDSPGSGYDTDGHGTFIAGQIAGSGLESTTVTSAEGSSNPPVSLQFRGMAPAAKLFAVGGVAGYRADGGSLGQTGNGGNDTNFFVIGQTNFLLPDAGIYNLGQTNTTNYFFAQYPDWYLQEAPAVANALISNNSWVNEGDSQYDLEAAGYDAATRDAVPGVTGPQPVLFVFPAGNGGNIADDISSPGTAKNVITVGAVELQRNITNTYLPFGSTNSIAAWASQTADANSVAGFSSCGNVGIGTEGAYGRFKPDVAAPGTFVISTRSTDWDQAAYYNPTAIHSQLYSGLFGGIGPDTVAINALNAYDFNKFGFSAQSDVVSISIQVLPENPASVTDMPIYFSVTNSTPSAGNNAYSTGNNVLDVPTADLPAIVANNGEFYFSVGNPTPGPVTYDIRVTMVTTNEMGDYYTVLSNLNNTLGPYYRYESGTSMAAADVSGVLALMQDYFTNTLHTLPSPALFKALLINGARTTSYYTLQVNNTINYEGWGLVNLPNSVPPTLGTVPAGTAAPVFFEDQSLTNALATGDTRTYTIQVPPAAQAQPLRITLAWTDPPGNPAAAIKLVNCLSLTVTNTDNATNPVVYYGNDIGVNQLYNEAQSPTNSTFTPDNINNVQNVFLPANAGTNFTVVVAGAAVNVNAVTTQTNDVAGNYGPNITQDYALVIATGNSATNGITVTAGPPASDPTGGQRITGISTTNTPLMNQVVGASTPVATNTIAFGAGSPYATNAVLTAGQTNQWHFYVVTNTGAAADYTNAAFVVFLPETLAIPRQGVFAGAIANSTLPEANLDLFATTDSNLLSLSPLTISNCMSGSSVGVTSNGVFYGSALARGGSKFIVDSQSTPGQVYYVGVQSEDQMAAEYNFLAEFSNVPFSQMNPNGELVTFSPVAIPDGDANQPGYTNTLGLAIYPLEIQRAIVTNVLEQQNVGDLVVAISHDAGAGSSAVTLLSHNAPNAPGIYTNIYDDSGQGDILGAQPSAGPGSLQQFVLQEGAGIWTLHAADNSPGFVGSIGGDLFLEKHQDLTAFGGILVTVPPNSWYYNYVVVPVGYTNLTVSGIDVTTPTPSVYVTLAVQLGADPTLSNNLASVQLNIPVLPAGLSNSISIGPPLTPGTYYVGLYNPDTTAHTVLLEVSLGFYTSAAVTTVDYASTGPVTLQDDAVTYAYLDVTNTDVIQGVNIGLRVDHSRISDLAFHLVSPDGTRYLLMENRGGQNTNGCGATYYTTNVFNAAANGNGLSVTNVFNIGTLSGTIPITYNFYTVPDEMTVYYGTNVDTNMLIFDSGFVSNPPIGTGGGAQNTSPEIFDIPYPGPGMATNSTYLTIVMNQFGTYHNVAANGTEWTYSLGGVATNYAYLSFTEDTNLTTTPIKFAPTPFVSPTIFTPVLAENFDSYVPGAYTSAASFGGGWIVATNQVEIVTNPIAYSLPNCLQLDNGVVYTNVPTEPARKYNFTYELASNAAGATNVTWQAGNFVFTATATNTTLVLASAAAALTGLAYSNSASVQAFTFATNALLDNLALTALPENLYYLPEQNISGLTGKRAYGTMAGGRPWQLEILDNRAGAALTNATTLVSWQLEFTFANTNLFYSSVIVGNGAGGIAESNTVAAGAIDWYAFTVPTNASYATNIIDFASLPVNLWFSTNYPPTTTNSGNVELISSATNGSALLSTNGSPVNVPFAPAYIVPGQTYYLGVQNSNDVAVTYAIEVDFDHGNSTNSNLPQVALSNAKVNAGKVQFSWSATAGAQYQVQWTTNLARAWNTITNPATVLSNGIATFTDDGSQTAPLGPTRFYRLVQLP